MALYHLTLAAVNRSKVARFPDTPKALLAVASEATEPDPIRRLAAMYAMSRGSLRFHGLARAAGADRVLRRVVAGEGGGVRREMAWKTLRAMQGDLDDEDIGGGGEYNDLTGSITECGDGEDCGKSIVSVGLMSFHRRQHELRVSSCGNTTEF